MGASVLPKEIQSSLQNLIEQKLEIKDYDLSFSKGSSKGDNYLGVLTRVTVTEKNDKVANPRIFNLIIKSAPQSEEFRKYIKIEILHGREVCMYEQVFPELKRFQEEVGLEDIFYPVPKCYKTSNVAPYEHLILEDMTAKGYEMKNRKIVTDLNHSMEVLKAYGKYHALCLALKIKEPEVFDNLVELTKETYFTNVNLENLCGTIKAVIDKVTQKLDQDKERKLIKKLNEFIKFPVNGLLENLSIKAANGDAVFSHGDSWINNILFKYEDNCSCPSKICFLDWQLSRCTSPAIDISYFIFSCTDKKLRAHHYEDLLNAYHSSLLSFLKQLGCDLDIFSKEKLLDNMKRFSKYGLMMCLITIPLAAAEMDEIPDWTNDMNEEERTKMFSQERKSEKYIINKLIDVVRDFDKLEYI
ncbi:uncharacterized protein LOC130452767 isoform X2 [Diorhabda sublineata]|uniref:uncharacterized protein LOC130452767 isoform X2 n=1 Tax=Diorhabda sublineata TaxID=1163346 RepID=UPI0024E12274|nr:uncharacterized protein LOC130452767 isoform X2 [Diorhabda sublineata]XP_056648171.1 uncharacterized protein LOC130452767 isoform X2 [Diorhabda sublineata]XP_056648172.1 uncharacterized protein LOC130452767 isoform X2 [Diorhabda sublineata]